MENLESKSKSRLGINFHKISGAVKAIGALAALLSTDYIVKKYGIDAPAITIPASFCLALYAAYDFSLARFKFESYKQGETKFSNHQDDPSQISDPIYRLGKNFCEASSALMDCM